VRLVRMTDPFLLLRHRHLRDGAEVHRGDPCGSPPARQTASMTHKRQIRSIMAAGVLTVAAVTAASGARVAGAAAQLASATPYSPTGLYANGALLPTGRLVTPSGAVVPVGDFPVAVAVSPDGRMAVVSNAGQGEGSNPLQGNQSLQVIDLSTNQVVQTVTDHAPGKDVFYNEGVAFSADGSKLYVTGGGNDAVYRYAVAGE